MDDYFISKDDWDTLIELGVGDNRDEIILKKISSGVKTAFTKKYGLMSCRTLIYLVQVQIQRTPDTVSQSPRSWEDPEEARWWASARH